MSGNPANASVWGGADVLIAPLGTPIPVAGAPFDTSAGKWRFVGLLDGGQGFEESIEQDSTDHSAWGYGVIATTYGNTKITKTFTAVEDNSVTQSLKYDVSGMTYDDEAGTYVGDLKVRDNTERMLVAFVNTSGATEKRKITKNYGTVAPTSAGSESEESLESSGFTVTIVPSEDKTIYYTWKGTPA